MSLRNSAVSITKLGVIELAALGLLVMLSQACSCLTISPTLDTFSDPRNSSLQLMTVHHRTGDVFVGGTNVILHLSENLTFLDEVRHNPVEDNPSCPPTPLMCNYSRQLTDTQIKLLLIDYNQTDGQDMLISCGSTRQGLCEISLVTDIQKRWSVGNEEELTNYVAGRESVIGFFSNGLGGPNTLYSAMTFDARGLNFAPAQVAARKIVTEGDRYSFKYAAVQKDGKTAIEFLDRYKNDYLVNYVYGFSHGNFSYFLTIQKVSTSTHDLESRLVRVHHYDPSFFSYVEVATACRHSDDTVFNMAVASYLATDPDDSLNWLQGDEEKKSLYVAFARTVAGKHSEVDPTRGSVICSFSMKEIESEFVKAIEECYNGSGNRVNWIVKNTKCLPVGTKVNNNFVGQEINAFIEGGDSIKGKFQTHLDDQVTALIVTVQNSKTVAVVGSTKGKLQKMVLNYKDSRVVHEISLADNLNLRDRAVKPSMAFDPSSKHLYVLTGNKVSRYPLGSCSVYTDCRSCLTSGDPLECGWCNDHCTVKEKCSYGFQKNSCPPTIFDFKPKSGPLAGGTSVNITGSNFGSSHVGKDNGLEVSIGLDECAIKSWKSHEIICVTRKTQTPYSSVIKVKVSDKSKTTQLYEISGDAFSKDLFDYVLPEVHSFQPTFGPLAGGTPIQIQGKNLITGSQKSVEIANIKCPIQSVSPDTITCITGKYEGKDEFEGKLQVSIDDAVFNCSSGWSTRNCLFTYKRNPHINTISPKSSPLSGGRTITVTGSFLESVANPKMQVIFTKPLTGGRETVSQPCEHVNDVIKCLSPNLTSYINYEVTSKAPLQTYLAFIMDGVEETRDLPNINQELSLFLYYPNPVFTPFPGDGHIKIVSLKMKILEIRGQNLNNAFTIDDITIVIDSNFTCKIQDLTESQLLCKMPHLPSALTQPQKVTVKAGSSIHEVGFLIFDGEVTDDNNSILALAIAIPCGILLVVIILLGLWRWQKKKRPFPNFIVTFRNEEEDLESDNSLRPTGGCRARDQQANDYYSLSNAKKKTITADGQISEETMQLLKTEEILISQDFLELGEVIGQGHFGRVYHGVLNYPGKPEPIQVAVKTLNNKEHSSDQDMEAFLNEGLMMKDFHHINVLSLVGVCFQNNGIPMVIIPFMRHGDLLSYIREESNKPTVKDLLNFAVQIAEGMKYLSEMKFVHRDLAARNCMLDEDFTVKVADFGLSRDVYESAYYCSENKKTKLPVKWMAIESLEKGQYGTKSDVWSYGVVLWELMTRGVPPYPDVDNFDVLRFLKSGRRMPQPSYCPNDLFKIMLQCWSDDSHERPTFADLVDEVRLVIKVMQRSSKQKTVGLDVTYINYPLPEDKSEFLQEDGAVASTSVVV